MRALRKKVVLVLILLLVATLLTACNYKDEVDYSWVIIPEGFIRSDSIQELSENNCLYVKFLVDCEIQAQFSTNGDSGFLSYIGKDNNPIAVDDDIYRAEVKQDEKLYVNSLPEQTSLLAMEQSFLSIFVFDNEKPVGYTLIYVAAFEIEGNRVTQEMMDSDTLELDQTYMFYIGNIIHSVKFTKGADITINEIEDRIYSMEINYLLGVR